MKRKPARGEQTIMTLPVPLPAKRATSDAPDPEHVRAALRSTLAAFRAVYYPKHNGVSTVLSPVPVFLDAVRSMVGVVDLRPYFTGSAGLCAHEDVARALDGLFAVCAAQLAPMHGLETAHVRAVAALAELESITRARQTT